MGLATDTGERDAEGRTVWTDVFHPHELRHTAAVHMLGAGVPLEKVSQVLGHSNTAVTFRTYARYLPNQMDDAVAALDFMNLRKVPK